MNFLLDSTAGLLVIYILLKLVGLLAKRCNIHSLRMGEYGECMGLFRGNKSITLRMSALT